MDLCRVLSTDDQMSSIRLVKVHLDIDDVDVDVVDVDDVDADDVDVDDVDVDLDYVDVDDADGVDEDVDADDVDVDDVDVDVDVDDVDVDDSDVLCTRGALGRSCAPAHVALVSHTQSPLSGEKSNKCNQCDYASSWAGNLRTHLKMHSGEKSSLGQSHPKSAQFQFRI